MAWQPRHLFSEQLEERRLAGARLLASGRSQVEVARELGVSEAAVSKWAARLRSKGRAGLKRRSHPGSPPRLKEAQWQQLSGILRQGPKASGFLTERWSLKRIAHVVAERFGVHYHPNYLAVLLHAHGFSPQTPRRRALERDEALIRAWLRHDWPRIKRGSAVPICHRVLRRDGTFVPATACP